MARQQFRVLPGFALTMGFTLCYLSAIVLIPFAALAIRTLELSWSDFWRLATTDRALAAYRLTFGASLIAAVANAVFGTLLAWVLVRYQFPGRRFIDAMVDFPFALPTAVAGLTLANLFAANGWLGQYLVPLGIKGAFTPLGVVIALTFVGLPFVVRTLQPVLQNLEREVEEAAATLGAGRLRTFVAIIAPSLMPAILTGFALAFARAIGEYGSIVFISGNLPFKTEIAPYLIVMRLEEYDTEKAAVLSFVMEGIHPHDIGTVLDRQGIAVRTGHHCAQPVMDRFHIPATTRASLAFYNTVGEIDALAAGLKKVKEIFS